MGENTVETVLVEALEKAVSAADFLAGEIPGVVQELLLYRTFGHSVLLTLWFSVFAFLIYKTPAWWRWMREEEAEPLSLALGFGLLASGLLFLEQVFSLIKVVFAPKLYLLEYVAELVK